MSYLVVKWLHILSSTFLFGTGIGSAFYMLFTSLSRDVRAIAVVSRHVVLADWIFTATTVVVQPVTGIYMIHLAGYPLQSAWIMWSIALYFVAGACWLPVVWIQLKMRDMAQVAARDHTELPPRYWRYLRIWTALGIPAFFALVVVFWLMVAKPV
ncbi:DUF2269 domain-containing protein [Massilia sp. CF038]|uniref:DUF2269 family protein n=1 Tax=Massilia sp. CF038 TaxID=1881045 RepID=UPI00091EC3F9|nr:DUF2269 domain-containing protein [Massilia sp. CF038]SHH45886.1 Uncharacterized membrane protein [Massilia sp. CF038]